MGKPITKVAAKSFRGATTLLELEFDASKDMSMIFGESGTGKSTILDAIDMVANGTIGALDGISCEGNKKNYLASVGQPLSTLEVSLHSNGDSWTAGISRNTVEVQGPEDRPQVQILRRSRVLDLITARPGERYEVLRHFVDVANVEKSENTLANKITAVGKDVERLVQRRSVLEEQLNTLWKSNGSPDGSSLEWAKKVAEVDVSDLKRQSKHISGLVSAIDKAIEKKGTLEKAVSATEEAREAEKMAREAIANLPHVDASVAVKLVDALSKTQEYIEATSELAACPTCLRPIERDTLSETVNEQLSQMTVLKDACDKQERAKKALDAAVQNELEAKRQLSEATKAIVVAIGEEDVSEITGLNIDWPDWEGPTEPSVEVLIAVVVALETVVEALRTRGEELTRQVTQYDSIAKLYEDIDEADTSYEQLARIKKGLEKALAIVRSKRVEFTQGILDEIAGETNRLYQAIHPDEDIEFSGLKMDEDKRGSVYQVGTFHGHDDIPPQALFSESHLDTLGFCVWLALAQRTTPADTIIIVDDVFSSVDASHLRRIAGLLTQEAKKFRQVIIATHYRLWWDRFHNAKGVERVQLGRWSVSSGVVTQRASLETTKLTELVQSPILDRQALASKAGILLENILDGLTLLYERPLPRNKDNLHTLGQLMDACASLVGKYKLSVEINGNWNTDGSTADWRDTELSKVFGRVKSIQFIRNQIGCHFNIFGMEIPDDDVREFGEATVAFVEAIVCPNCGQVATQPTSDKSARRCMCKKPPIRMTPLFLH